MPIPQESAARMMVKCGRRCCVCRRFRPTRLQVHHIIEQTKGGSDEDDNLIVVCFSCHTDIHTLVPFARRFSEGELKGHRDALCALMSSGSLPTNDSDDTDDVIARIVGYLRSPRPDKLTLMPEAVELLLKAALTEGAMQGQIHFIPHDGGLSFLTGGIQVEAIDRRSQAKYKAAFDQLIQTGLLERRSGAYSEVTYDGYLAADELAVTAGE